MIPDMFVKLPLLPAIAFAVGFCRATGPLSVCIFPTLI